MNREEIIKTGEHDYCMWAMNTLAQKMALQGQNINSPLEQMIDNATGNNGVVWEDVAMLTWWTDKIMELRKSLDIPMDGLNQMNNGLKRLMLNSGKLEFYEKAKLEMKED